MQTVPAASTYSGVLAKQTPVLWAGVQPLLASAFVGKPYILDRMITGKFFTTYVRSQALLPDGKLDGRILTKINADVLGLADHVLLEVLINIAYHTLDICHCPKTLARSDQQEERLRGGENIGSAELDAEGKILSISLPNITRDRVNFPVLKALLLREGKVQRESDIEHIVFYFGTERDERDRKYQKVLIDMNQYTDNLCEQSQPEQYFTQEADTVPSFFISKWQMPPHVRESDHKQVYSVRCLGIGKQIFDKVTEIQTGRYFNEGMNLYHIDPAQLQNIQSDFTKIVTIVGNLVKNVPQCSLYLQDLIRSLEIFNRQNPSGLPRNCEEDVILFIASTIFFREDRAVDVAAPSESPKCLATQCLHFRTMNLGESIDKMKQTFQTVEGGYRAFLQLLSELNEGIPVPGVL